MQGQRRLREERGRGNVFMHTTEQGDFLPTPSLKCIAWNILSDKVPATQSHSLAPPRLRLGACHGFILNVWFPTVWHKTLCKLCAATAVDIIGGADRGCWRLELWPCLGSQVQGGETLLTGSSHTVREPSCICHPQTLPCCPEIMSLLHPTLIYYNTVIFLLMEYLQASSLHLEASLKSFLGSAVVIPWDTKAGKLPSHSAFLARRYLLQAATWIRYYVSSTQQKCVTRGKC